MKSRKHEGDFVVKSNENSIPKGSISTRAYHLSEGDIFQIKHKEIDSHFKFKNNKLYEVEKDDMEWLGNDEIGWLGQPTWRETGKIYTPEEINEMLFE